MVWLKSVLTGILTVLFSALLLGLGVLVWQALPFIFSRSTGSGGIGAVSIGFSSASLLLFVAVTFGLGFVWRYRRLTTRVLPR